MRTYWLHVIADRSPQSGVPSTYLLARADAPSRNAEGGSMPTVHYPSWEQLGRKLSAVGVDGEVLQRTKDALDSKGTHTITEVVLSDEQVGQLGFTDVAA
jgi:hypothetical protein